MTALTRNYLLPAASVIAVYVLWIFAYQNGYLGWYLGHLRAGSLPNTDEKRQTFSNFEFINLNALAIVLAYWPVVDGNSPAATLTAVYVASVCASCWLLTLLEWSRKGNKGKIRIPAVLLWQLGFAFGAGSVLPWGFRAHASVALQPTIENMSVPRLDLLLLPLSLGLSLGVAITMVAVPEKHIAALMTRQTAMIVLQFWPSSAVLIHSSLRVIATCASPDHDGHRDQARHTLGERRTAFRYFYAFAFVVAAIPHIAVCAISFCAYVGPTIFNPEIVDSLQPRTLLLPLMPWSGAQSENIAVGLLWFLQWDHVLMGAPLLLWVVPMFRAMQATRRFERRVLELTAKILLLSLVSGMAGAAVALMWEREELLLESASALPDATAKKNGKGKEAREHED